MVHAESVRASLDPIEVHSHGNSEILNHSIWLYLSDLKKGAWWVWFGFSQTATINMFLSNTMKMC